MGNDLPAKDRQKLEAEYRHLLGKYFLAVEHWFHRRVTEECGDLIPEQDIFNARSAVGRAMPGESRSFADLLAIHENLLAKQKQLIDTKAEVLRVCALLAPPRFESLRLVPIHHGLLSFPSATDLTLEQIDQATKDASKAWKDMLRDLRAELQGQPPATHPSPAPPPALLSAADLARLTGESVDKVDSFLRRYREDYPDCYVVNESKRKTDPKYLYRTADVLPALQARAKSPPVTDE